MGKVKNAGRVLAVIMLAALSIAATNLAQTNMDMVGTNPAQTNQAESSWPAPGVMLLAPPAPQNAGTSPGQTNDAGTPWPAPGVMIMAPPAPQKIWADYVTVYGSMRLRFETINDDAKKKSDGEHYTRDRLRIKGQLGAEAKLEDLKAGVRLSTGGADPVSANVTLGEGLQKEDIRFDLAYLDYALLNADDYGLNAVGGKMQNPLIAYGADDLVWDQDLTPEGLAVKSKCGNERLTFLANAEYLFVKERDSQPNAWGWVGQGALQFEFIPEISLTLGGSYSAYQNIKGYDVIDWENKNNSYGNSTIKGSVSGNTTNKAWATDFTPVMGFGNLDLFVWKMPVSIYGQALANPGADDNNKGYLGGLSLFKARNPKSFEIGYAYALLEKDAALGMWTDSDRWGGGTDGKGSRFYGKYQITKYLQFAVIFFLDKKNIADNETEASYNRLQIDLQGTF